MSGSHIGEIKSDESSSAPRWWFLTTTDDKIEIDRCYDMWLQRLHLPAGQLQSFSDAIRQLGLFLSVIRFPEASA